MPLARMETTLAINALLDRLPPTYTSTQQRHTSINGVAFLRIR